jgi:hypothetical protein
MTADEFEAAYAQRSGITVARLRELGRVVKPCDCGDAVCEGWQSVNAEGRRLFDMTAAMAKLKDMRSADERCRWMECDLPVVTGATLGLSEDPVDQLTIGFCAEHGDSFLTLMTLMTGGRFDLMDNRYNPKNTN